MCTRPDLAVVRTILVDVRPWGGTTCDIVVESGQVTAVEPSRARDDEKALIIPGNGRIALPSFTDAHAHLDSTRLGLPFRPHTAGDGLAALIENDRVNWRNAEAPVEERATRTLGRTIADGATLVRSHAQIDTSSGLDRLHGVLAAKQTHRQRAEVQVVAFPQVGIVRDQGTAALLGAALDDGADLIGGIDPCGLDRSPLEHLDVVFDLAEHHQVDLDIHLHEPGELGAFTLSLIIERVRALGMQGHVTISHAFTLATSTDAVVRDLIAALAEADVAITTIAPGKPRALPVGLLDEHAVRLGLGQDGMRDYWSPFGDADMLGRVWQFAFTQNLRRDADIERCVRIASLGGRSVITREAVSDDGFAIGSPADFVLLPGETVTSAVMDRPGNRAVVHAGRMVADAGDLLPDAISR